MDNNFVCIWGGIVTYNPDMERLYENVAAIKPQVDKLVIFDNGSDNVRDVQSFFDDIEIISSPKNLGMAKALNQLARRASDAGATDILFLDQDSVAADNLVSVEAGVRAEGTGIVCCLAIDRNHRPEDTDTTRVYEVKRPITSGSMVNLAAWRAVGGYDERLFVDWVDNEFCDNLRTHNYCIMKTNRTHILHELGHQEYLWTGPGQDDFGHGHAMRDHYRQNYPAWRWKDRARSQVITIGKYGWSSIGIEERIYFLRNILRILFVERDRAKNWHAMIEGYKCGRAALVDEEI